MSAWPGGLAGLKDWHGVLDHARQVLAEEYGVTHATIQVEPHDHDEQPAAV